jgi:Spy/CpxP family protein refolding chaperone
MQNAMPFTSLKWFRRFGMIACVAVGLCTTAALHAAPGDEPTSRPARFGQGPGPAGREPGFMLKILRERLDKLDLSADQKKQIDQIFADAEPDFKKAIQDTQGQSRDQRMEKMRGLFSEFREKVAGVLTEEQKQKLQKEMADLRASNGGQANPLNRLKENLEKLGLSDDQKSKALGVVDDAQKKMTEMREQIENGNGDRQQVQEKGQQIRQEMQGKLAEILTQEQQDKLRSTMPQEPGANQSAPHATSQPTKAPKADN